MTERIIFLDIDGVLVTPQTESIVIGPYSKFDPDCVAVLNRLTSGTGAKLVLSSSWRIGEDLDDLRAYFRSQNVRGELIDATPVRRDSNREQEILDWLQTCSSPPVFAILDDDLWFDRLSDRHIHTDSQTGLTEALADAAAGLLRST